MARKRRKRLKWYAGGGIVIVLLFLLGDPSGAFRPAEQGPEGTNAGRADAGDPRPVRESKGEVPPGPRPDAELASRGADRRERAKGAADVDGGAGETTQREVEKPGPEPAARGDAARGDAARVDELMGIIAGYERALSADDLAGLAVLVDRIKSRPVTAPASLTQRWRTVQSRADAALACEDRIRGLVKAGEILHAERLVGPLLQPSTPEWMRARLDAAAARFGWPALSHEWRVVDPEGATGEMALPKMRRVRFVRNGELHEGRLWRSGVDRSTVRMTGAGGYTFPVLARSDVEPVAPEPEEALAQGIVAARAQEARRVALWSCHFHERGDPANASRLRAMIR